ncbi:lamin tail domain-containing protein [Nocardioides ultimimeridianus]
MSRPFLAGLGLAAAAASAVVAVPTAAHAVSGDVVISEVYGGGGNSGAPYRSDFVELINTGSASVSVTGWSVQYASASGTTWSRTALSGSIAAGATYLVQLATGTTGSALPTPQATGTTNLSATSGKVALVTTNTTLTCGATCHSASGVKDYVGYGTATDFEGAAAPAGSNTASVTRTVADTDHNSTDFAAAAPTPGTSILGSGGGTSCTGTQIHTIQGASQLATTGSVSGVAGIVTGVGPAGFFLEEPTACQDTSVATSEGIYVYTSSAPTVAVGDSVKVAGTVSEYRSGGTTTANLTSTEITAPTVTKVSSGNPLPAPVTVGAGSASADRIVPSTVIENDSSGNVETSNTFDPASDGLDFWESLEDMRVTILGAQVVGPTSTAYGETPIVPNGAGTRTPRGGIQLTASDPNPERIVVSDLLAPSAVANVGDGFGNLTGVVDYGFGTYDLEPSATPSVTHGGLTAESTTAATSGQLAAATFNVENLDPTDPQTKFDGLAAQLVSNLKSPDLVSLEEIQDNDGATDDGVVACDQTMAKLIAAISAAGGPAYSWTSIDPQNDTDGGEPGGNIRQVFMYRTDRGLSFTGRGAPTYSTNATLSGTGSSTTLVTNPSRIQPTNSAWSSSRKPLVGQFSWNGKSLFVIANHFNSKGGDDPDFGKDQPPVHSSETQRHNQASLVRTFTDSLLAADPNARVVVMGDLNDYEFSQTADILVGSGTTALNDLPRTLPANERYTYDYQGNSQVLDHILLSPALSTFSYDVVHANSEFSTQMSDHDPSVVRLTF